MKTDGCVKPVYKYCCTLRLFTGKVLVTHKEDGTLMVVDASNTEMKEGMFWITEDISASRNIIIDALAHVGIDCKLIQLKPCNYNQYTGISLCEVVCNINHICKIGEKIQIPKLKTWMTIEREV
jgi:Ni,Fe-hydrogenase maturation factor